MHYVRTIFTVVPPRFLQPAGRDFTKTGPRLERYFCLVITVQRLSKCHANTASKKKIYI